MRMDEDADFVQKPVIPSSMESVELQVPEDPMQRRMRLGYDLAEGGWTNEKRETYKKDLVDKDSEQVAGSNTMSSILDIDLDSVLKRFLVQLT